jgi:hypothetical protein
VAVTVVTLEKTDAVSAPLVPTSVSVPSAPREIG